MRKIVVITTGGLIAIKRGPSVSGVVPAIKGDEFLAQLPRGDINLVFTEFSNVPASHTMPAQVLELSHRAESVLLAPDVAGLVVSHGIDTLEETAYLLDLTLNSPKPVVVTGAVRAAMMLGYDGMTNLVSAIRVAASPDARGLGTLVVFNEQIFAASDARNIHTQSLDPFGASNSGPLGRVEGERVRFHHRTHQRMNIPCSRLEERVDLISISQGADDRMLRHSIADGVAGIVIEAFGGVRVPPWWLPNIREAINQGIALAIASRCGAGSLYDDYGYVGAYHDLHRMGVLFSHNLNGAKTRIKLMVALGAVRKPEELQGWFAG